MRTLRYCVAVFMIAYVLRALMGGPPIECLISGALGAALFLAFSREGDAK